MSTQDGNCRALECRAVIACNGLGVFVDTAKITRKKFEHKIECNGIKTMMYKQRGGSMLPILKVQSLLLHNDEAHPTKGFESLPCQVVYQTLEPILQIDWQCVQSSNQECERRVGHHLPDKQIRHHLKLKIEE